MALVFGQILRILAFFWLSRISLFFESFPFFFQGFEGFGRDWRSFLFCDFLACSSKNKVQGEEDQGSGLSFLTSKQNWARHSSIPTIQTGWKLEDTAGWASAASPATCTPSTLPQCTIAPDFNYRIAVIFFSLVFWFPWSFINKEIPWFLSFFRIFLCFSRGFWGSEGGKNSLLFWRFSLVLAVFLGIYLNTKEKKIRVISARTKRVSTQTQGVSMIRAISEICS